MRRREQEAVDAVARHFSATWETGEGPPDAYVTMAGTRITVDVTSLKPLLAAREGRATPRLRFDRVVVGLVRRLQAALQPAVPEGQAVIVTVTAPIRLPAKTASALEDKIRTLLARRTAWREIKHTIHGNRVRIRLVRHVAPAAAKVVGLVHNPETEAALVLDIAQSLLLHIGAAAERPAPARVSGTRWLVVASAGALAPIETYRQIYAQLSLPSEFGKILMVFAGGRVETLIG